MIVTAPLAERVMRARATRGRCPHCSGLLVQGQLIALAGRRWRHAACLVGRAEQAESMTAGRSKRVA